MRTNNKRTASITLTKSGKKLVKIRFPYNTKDLRKVKSIDGSRYHETQRCWSVPFILQNAKKLEDWGFSLDTELSQLLVSFVKIKKIPGFGVKPKKFQLKGIGITESWNGRALIADEQGLGKTIEALGWLQLHLKTVPALFTVPSSVKINWERETQKCLSKYQNKIQILSGRTPYPITGKIIIINYDIIHYWRRKLKQIKFKLFIGDECQYIKNDGAKRTKAIKTITKNIPHVLMLSGTPIEKKPIEIYNAVNIINPELFPNPWKFKERYCGPKNTGFGRTYNGATNVEELHRILIKNVMIRRLKKDVLKELPNKSYSFVSLSITNETEYSKAETDILEYLREEKGKKARKRAKKAKYLVQRGVLKQLAIEGKMKEVIEWIAVFLSSGEKLVVFGIHTKTIETIMKVFPNAVRVDGSVTGKKRQDAIDRFQNDPTANLFIGNLKAAGVGITLTAASNVAIIEYPDNPAWISQAIDRVHRITQLKKVMVYYLLARGTIEEIIARNLDKEKEIVTGIIDGKSPGEGELIMELIEEI